MPALLTICDQALGGSESREWTLEVSAERITVRELIRSRVYQEVSDFNTLQPQRYRGLIQPTLTESRINAQEQRVIDWKAQFELACNAFEAGRILILVGDQQMTSLEAEIEINSSTTVTFLRLMLLVGG
ncbi:MAG: hypothetical protein JSS49_15550 [Planctomycetes bacterium]|nr:hypothetical protein [Planctomycetota bacterium]